MQHWGGRGCCSGTWQAQGMQQLNVTTCMRLL